MTQFTRLTMKCISCGSQQLEFQYQARAADEAARTVTTCPHCPLDARKVTSPPRPNVFPRRFSQALHRRNRSSTSSAGGNRKVITYIELSFVSPSAHGSGLKCAIPSYRGGVSDILTAPALVRETSYGPSTLCNRIESPLITDCIVVERSRKELAPGVHEIMLHTYDPPAPPEEAAYEWAGQMTTGSVSTKMDVRLVTPPAGRYHRQHLQARCDTSDVRQMQRQVCELFRCSPVTYRIRDFLDRNTLAAVKNLAPRAWDTSCKQLPNHYYTPKIDGERRFLVVYRRLALSFRKGEGDPLVGISVLDTERHGQAPLVMDVEYTSTHGYYLIDMLTDSTGNPSPEMRTILWVLEQFEQIERAVKPVGLHVRPYFHSFNSAEAYTQAITCPVDGVVAIPKDSTSSKKIKDARSVELRYDGNGSFKTEEGNTVVCWNKVPKVFKPGDIVELRFLLCSSGKSINVISSFLRTDKSQANSADASRKILSSFSHVTSTNETRRRSVLLWCNTLRTKLHTSAVSVRADKRIVLDIGTGTGQSLDSYHRREDLSFILVEKDPDRCEKLARRLRITDILRKPQQILGRLRMLKMRTLQHCVICCSLEDILADEDLCRTLMPELRVSTAFFSAHFVTEPLYELASYWEVPLVGCAYVYDDVSVGEHLVNDMDVKMKRVSEDMCTVKWGGDEVYEEPFITTSDFTPFSNVTPAIRVLPPPDDGSDDGAANICGKIVVISSGVPL